MRDKQELICAVAFNFPVSGTQEISIVWELKSGSSPLLKRKSQMRGRRLQKFDACTRIHADAIRANKLAR